MFQEIAYICNNRKEETQLFSEDNNKMQLKTRHMSLSNTDKSARKFDRKTSLIYGQKLRESKWFTHEEINIICAVLESGFIVQKKYENGDNYRGVAMWTSGYEKSKNPDFITIHTVELQNGLYKINSCNLLSFWSKESVIRINNQSDETNTPNSEEVIQNQILYAQNNKHKWYNSEHFTYWCRYGTPVKYIKSKHASESFKWGNFSLQTGLLLLKGKKKNENSSK